MTDEALRELVIKHDHAIESLVGSVENLVESNMETNKQLKDISKFLAKQAVFDAKFDNMDKAIKDTFKQAFSRIDKLEEIQGSNNGCKSVQLLGKDFDGLEKGYVQMAGAMGDIRISAEKMEKQIDSMPLPATIRWFVGLIAVYMISFGTYVVSSLQQNEVMITKIMEHIQ